MLEAIRLLRRELAGSPAHRLRGRAVHAGLLRDRGRPLQRTSRCTKALMYGEPATWHRLAATARRGRRATTCARRSRPAPRRCSSSTPGSARSTRPTTASSCCPTCERIFDGLAGPRRAGDPLRHRHRPPARAQREAGGDVIGVDWRTPLDEGWRRRRRRRAPCRATSTPRCSSPRRERLLRRVDDVLRRAGGRPATSSTWATASCRGRRSRT